MSTVYISHYFSLRKAEYQHPHVSIWQLFLKHFSLSNVLKMRIKYNMVIRRNYTQLFYSRCLYRWPSRYPFPLPSNLIILWTSSSFPLCNTIYYRALIIQTSSSIITYNCVSKKQLVQFFGFLYSSSNTNYNSFTQKLRAQWAFLRGTHYHVNKTFMYQVTIVSSI